MLGLSGFFKNIQNAFTKEVILRTSIKDAIKKQTGIDIEIENISCKGGVVALKNISQSALSVVFIKKQKIIAELSLGQSTENITDIR